MFWGEIRSIHTVGCAHKHSIIKWASYIYNLAWAASEGAIKLCEGLRFCAKGTHSGNWLVSPSLYLWRHGEDPMIRWQRKSLRCLVYRPFCNICRHYPRHTTVAPVWDILEEQWWRQILLKGRTSSPASECSFYLEGKMDRYYMLAHKLWPMVWLWIYPWKHQGNIHGKNMIGQLVTR